MKHQPMSQTGARVGAAELESDAELVQRLAWAAANRYARACRGFVSSSELFSAAQLACVTALGTFDPARGTPRGAYVWQAALNAARRSAHTQGCPVEHQHRVEKLQGLRSVPTVHEDPEDGAMVTDAAMEAAMAFELDPLSPEEEVANAERAAAIRARLVAVLGENGAALGVALFTGEWSPKQVADHHGVPVRHVYYLQQTIRARVEGDAELLSLWENRDQ